MNKLIALVVVCVPLAASANDRGIKVDCLPWRWIPLADRPVLKGAGWKTTTNSFGPQDGTEQKTKHGETFATIYSAAGPSSYYKKVSSK